MYKFFTIILAAGLMAFSLPSENSKPDKVTINGLVKSLTAKEINIMEYGKPFNFEADNKVKIDEKGNFTVELDAKEGQYYYVIYKRGSQLIYLSPGDDLSMTFDGRKINTTMSYEGTAKDINDYLVKRLAQDKVSQQMVNHGGKKFGLYQEEWTEYLKIIDENRATMQSSLDELKKGKKLKGGFKRFLELEQAHIDGTWAFFYLQYPSHHAHFTKKNPVEFWSNLDLEMIKKEYIRDNEKLIMSKSYRDFLNQYTLSLSEKTFMDSKLQIRSKSEFIKRAYNNVDNVLELDWMAKYIKARLLYEQIDKHGLTNMQEPVDNFNTLKLDKPEYLVAVQKVYNKWALTMPGAQAPDIVGTDIDGKTIKLSDFRGKLVYIDVWATWCGPCRKEIPSLKKVEKEFHGKDVVFMSVSIDDNRGRWEKMVKDENLGGVQIQMTGGWGSKICKEYNISSIPRFMLIDQEGKVINVKTTRPSQGIGPLLEQYL